MNAAASNGLGRLGPIAILLALPLIYGALFFVLRPSMVNDAGAGFSVLESMRAGAPFNVLIAPSSDDISKDAATFVAAWSPAQYLLPAAFQLLGLDLGQAIDLTVTLCAVVGIVGWYLLYRAFGFSPRISLITCLLVEIFRFYLTAYYQYPGGESTLFAAAPYSALLVWRATSARPAASFAAVLSALVLATFAKLSGFLFVTSLLGGVAVHFLFKGKPSVRSFVMPLIPIALAWLVFLAGFYLLWVTGGATAVDRPGLHFVSLTSLFFPVVSVFVSAFGMIDALGFIGPMMPAWSAGAMAWVTNYLAFLPFCLVILVYIVRRRSGGDATTFILASAFFYAAIFIVLFNSGAALYFDDRFFRPASLLLLPCLIAALISLGNLPLRLAGWAFVLVFVLYGAVAAVKHVAEAGKRPLGAMGFRHPVASAGLVRFLQEKFGAGAGDRGRRLVYVMSSEVPLEIRSARVIATEADYEPLATLQARRYRGRVAELYVALPATFLRNGKAEAILKSFVDYDPSRWKEQRLDDRFVVFSQ